MRSVATVAGRSANGRREIGKRAADELCGSRILVVEDDDTTRELLTVLLEMHGAVVTATSSVDEALQAFGKEIPDVLLSDIGMPERNGYDLIRHIRALPREQGGDVPAAALTAYFSETDRREGLSAGFQIYLGKPFDLAHLCSTLKRLMRSRGAPLVASPIA
jgi:CheY-like chemotaxis protein